MKTGKTLQDLAIEIERQYETKKDFIAPTDKIGVEPDSKNGLTLVLPGKGEFPVNDIAHDQIAGHTKIPRPYYDRMRNEDADLLATNVDRWFKKYPSPQMIRTLDGRNRAFLSDKFAPLDNYDFAGATLPILKQRRLTVMSCEITEKRLYIKAVDEQLFRDVPVGFKMGDGSHRFFTTVAPAVILSNSEVGYGRLVVDTGVYEKVCTNLAMFGKFRRTHVGARHKMTENFDVEDLDRIMSQATKRKTHEALWLQVRDVIASAFDEKVVRERAEMYEAAGNRAITRKLPDVMEVVQERFGFNDTERDSIFDHLIKGGQLSQYGLHAAVTRASQDVESYDRATELEYIGGKIVELARTEWAQLAEAA